MDASFRFSFNTLTATRVYSTIFFRPRVPSSQISATPIQLSTEYCQPNMGDVEVNVLSEEHVIRCQKIVLIRLAQPVIVEQILSFRQEVMNAKQCYFSAAFSCS